LTSKNIGIVGKSGTGKTTLLFLILRLYQPEKGEILIDDIDINKISEDSFKKDVAIALEEPFLFNDTIANNIFYGLEEQNTEDRLIWAAKIAKVDDFVNKLKDKYNTNLGQSGIKLSKGQRQRISIARALIKKPKILLLDEATSSLDSDTEKNIIENLKKELKYATIILVSHRFSAIKEMEEILFLEDKDKIIKGKHKELIENYLPYQKFFYEQRIS
jgi:ATP-binding cassette subfamily B protein